MLKPIIILEHHLDQTPIEFVVKNINSLKDLGYKKVLLEMNKEQSLEQFIALNKSITSNLEVPQHIRNKCSALISMVTAIKNAKMELEFIDPQTLSEAQQLERNVQKAKTKIDRDKALCTLDEARKSRDQIISEKFVAESNKNAGGILCISGFTHIDLLQNVNRLTASSTINPCYLILSNFDTCLIGKSADDRIWEKINDPNFRKNYYQTDVKVITNPMSFSFECLENSLALSPREKDIDCYIGKLLNESLNTKFNYEFDKFGVLSGSILCETKKDLDSLSASILQKFPGLYFQPGQRALSLEIVGVNLKENAETLSKEFKKMGLMH